MDAPMQTQHANALLALRHVQSVAQLDRATQRIYGGLCHNIPVLLRANGLCQTVAFLAEKGKGGAGNTRSAAYTEISRHLAEILGLEPARLQSTIYAADLPTTIWYTRRLLAAWIYYKRFAVSILDVEAGGDDDHGGPL